MKKSLLALVALGAFAGAAHAQSSVTLYGIIDEGLLFNNNAGGKHLYSMASGVMQGSRFGLRGTEDLGGGLGLGQRLELVLQHLGVAARGPVGAHAERRVGLGGIGQERQRLVSPSVERAHDDLLSGEGL